MAFFPLGLGFGVVKSVEEAEIDVKRRREGSKRCEFGALLHDRRFPFVLSRHPSNFLMAGLHGYVTRSTGERFTFSGLFPIMTAWLLGKTHNQFILCESRLAKVERWQLSPRGADDFAETVRMNRLEGLILNPAIDSTQSQVEYLSLKFR